MKRMFSGFVRWLPGVVPRSFLLLALAFIPLLVHAYDVEVDGVYYELYKDYNYYQGNAAKVVGYDPEKIEAHLQIPYSIYYEENSYTVSRISSFSFSGCEKIERVFIPANIESIEKGAFSNCPNLKEFIVAWSFYNLSMEGYKDEESGIFFHTPLKTLYTGRNIYSGSWDFNPAFSINSAFSNLPTLETVDLKLNSYISDYEAWEHREEDENKYGNKDGWSPDPSAVTTLRAALFRGCTGLTSVVIPASVTNLYEDVFADCTSLREVIIEDGEDALLYQENYPVWNGVEEVMEGTFVNCPIEKLYLGRTLKNRRSEEETNYEEREIEYLKENLDHYFKEDLENPDRLPPRQYSLFSDNTHLRELEIGEKVKSIDHYMFYGCENLTSLYFPDSIEDIGIGAFSECHNLETVRISAGIRDLKDETFSGCHALREVIFPWFYEPCDPMLESIGRGVFRNCGELSDFQFPWTLKSIGAASFYRTALRPVLRLDETQIEEIGKSAFRGCSNLHDIYFPDKLKIVGDDAFSECGSLSGIEFPGYVERIGSGAFFNCQSLKSVKLPPSLIQLGEDPKTGYYDQWNMYSERGVFEGCNSLEYIAIPETVKILGNRLFWRCENLREVMLPSSIERLPDGIFANCWALTDVTIPRRVTSIGISSFSGCNSLESIDIPESVTIIGSSAFYGCSSIEEILVPEGIKRLEDNLFSRCTSLKKVNLPSSLLTIGYESFEKCEQLENLTVKAVEPPTFDYSSGFSGVDKSSVVVKVPEESVEAYRTADVWKDFLFITPFTVRLDDADWENLKRLKKELLAMNWQGDWNTDAEMDAVDSFEGVTVTGKHVAWINLSNAGLKGKLPLSAFRFRNLVKLDLSGNEIEDNLDSSLSTFLSENPESCSELVSLN
ncbi:MAG: leucine-rich repeat protein, partial [Muribaculaceae bacterium]|nr:leucine-rich repeat protein [Muribaculaceae bacterium]